ncbi:AraC family transcriptional regulator [Erysipelothrix larvae]|uniref:AraC family transcriptional regulator n=1 Tax=Erysipelothrix larvae TaxID=1514105 RepID=A0A109UH98_9FIRM|nr:GyrI-like domain-containing protein [Erysipelothrix larvae]AMC93841.1 AraC family transcriptional regulator [Erysipelothrix larvae]
MNEPHIRIEEDISLKLIYIRFKGSYAAFRKHSRAMFNTLFEYAKKHDLIIEGETKVLTLYHDNPFITHGDNLRTSVAMTIPSTAVIDETNEISTLTLSGKFCVGTFDLKLNEYGLAWNTMIDIWTSYPVRDALPFELYVTEPPRNFKGSSSVDIYVPIQ